MSMHRIKYIIIIVCALVLFSSYVSAQVEIPVVGQQVHHLCGTPFLTPEIIQKAYLNTVLRTPELLQKPTTITEWQQRNTVPVIGDSIQLYVLNVKDNQYYPVWAELRAAGSMVYIWVEKSQLQNGTVQQTYVDQLLNLFEADSPSGSVNPNKGIIQIEREFFGSEPNKDGDGKTDIILFDIIDYFNPPSNTSYVSGFFLSNDQSNAPFSNRRDILYLDTNPTIAQNTLLTTAAHEYQHLIHYYYDTNETELINEGASQLAQYITGLQWDDPSLFFQNTDRGLFQWAEISDPSVIADYLKAQMWMLYLYDQFGGNFVRSLVQNSQHGIASIENTLITANAGLTFTYVLQNWFIANYVNDTSVNPAYGYVSSPALSAKAQLLVTEKSFPAVRNNESLNPYAAEYVRFKNGLRLSGTFSSSFTAAYMINKTVNSFEISPVQTGAAYSDSQFGLAHKEIILTAMNKTANSSAYSYNFTASQLYFIRELQYDDGIPDVVEGGQTGIWWGTNKPGFGWAVKFTPPNTSSVLIGAKAYVIFYPVEMGSPYFLLKVYDSSGPGGLPGSLIIPPQNITLQPSVNYYWWEIDLTQYDDILSNYQGSFYLSLEHPDTSGIYIGVDKTDPTASYSYGLVGPSGLGTSPPGWYSMSNIILDSTSMAPFDLMIRAEMKCFDSETPIFAVGYIQNPVFTENFDIYIVGEKEISSDRLTAALHSSDSVKTLNLISSGQTGRVLVDNAVTLSTSGIVTLYISGMYKFGIVQKDTTVQFSILQSTPQKEGILTTPSGRSSLIIPPYTVLKYLVFSAKDGVAEPMLTNERLPLDNNSVPLGDVVSYGPPSANGKLYEVQFHFDPYIISEELSQHLAIAKRSKDKWEMLPSSVDYAVGIVRAYTADLGVFQLRKYINVVTTRPSQYELFENYPNPFNQQTVIRFVVPQTSDVSIVIFDVLGRSVREFVMTQLPAGINAIQWDGLDGSGLSVGSGIYFYQMKAGSFVKTKRMVLIK